MNWFNDEIKDWDQLPASKKESIWEISGATVLFLLCIMGLIMIVAIFHNI